MVRPLPLKFALVGDTSVGKTSLLLSFVREHFPDESSLSSIETLAKVVSVDTENFSVTIVDSSGSSKHDRIRPLSFYYPQVDVFLMCYDISDRNSYENISSKWILETHKHCPKANIFIVGTKLDLKNKSPHFISETEGVQAKNLINACGFLEVSAKSGENVMELFTQAVRIAKSKYNKTNTDKR